METRPAVDTATAAHWLLRKQQTLRGWACLDTCAFNGMVSLTANSLTTGGYVVLENANFQGNRVGTFLMNEIVQWVQQWPDATVRTVSLLSGQAHGDNKERRNRFYEQLGLEFDYDDSEHKQGSRPMLAKQLKRVETWKENITVHSMPDYLANILHEKERDSLELMQRNRAVKDLFNEQRAAEAKPIRWALRTLYSRYQTQVVGGVLLAMLALEINGTDDQCCSRVPSTVT